MTRHETIVIAIGAACSGYPDALRQLIYYFTAGGIPLDRLVKIAKRQFGMPNKVAWGAIWDLCPELIQ